MIVLDSSAAIQYFLLGARHPLIAAAREIIVPNHIDVEFMNGVRRLELKRKVSEDGAMDMLLAFFALPLMHFAMSEFMEEMWLLRRNITPYDAAYVCLARALSMPIVTADGRLSRAASGLVEVIDFD